MPSPSYRSSVLLLLPPGELITSKSYGRSVRGYNSLSKLACLVLLPLLTSTQLAAQQVQGTEANAPSYKMSVSVNEVKLAFEAVDVNGAPVTDLQSREIDVLDNDQGPFPIARLQRTSDHALHVAFLVDVSQSVAYLLHRNRQIAAKVANAWIVEPDDEADFIAFDRSRHSIVDWTAGPVGIRNALSNGSLLPNNPVGGTGIYDALFSECTYSFANEKVGPGRDTIALFSDGEDTSSRMTLASAVQACRKNNVAVYAFSPKPLASLSPLGVSTLREISDETGGILLALGDGEDSDLKRLGELSSVMRSGYILFYKPGALKPDGSFHRIVLVGPTRVAVIRSTPGYYAPSPTKP